MLAKDQTFTGKTLILDEGSSNPNSSHTQSYHSSSGSAQPSHFPSGNNGGFHTSGYFTNRGSHFRGRGRGHNHYPSGPRTHQAPLNSSPGILGSGIDIPTCQICNKKGHVAADCYQRRNQPSAPTSSGQCPICWKYGHSAI
ncbi:hypothetical protein L3X38_010251 [Prunus dulcis]|uniref:CCHC-type domain-containing protein n=1 Tax=Prunus dulcis TaxID=3755 RepID=A0AAD4WHL0_PRUDU|nr:hypothetical protein L3X38_010251 [Prunus dulcis]